MASRDDIKFLSNPSVYKSSRKIIA